ncbi:MAG: DUF5671 domain-containing protein [Candidatus Falkowbacteria bacterium]
MNNAKFTFLYLLSLVALGFVAVSCGTILFQIINKTVIDAGMVAGTFAQDAIKFGIAAIFVAAPVYYLTTRMLLKSMVKGDLPKDSGARRWLTYLILFAASMTVLGWLIGTFNLFLSGELTVKFGLKLATVVIISAVVFGYYFYDIRRNVIAAKDKTVSAFCWGSLALVLVIFVSAWFFIDSPATARAKNLDNQILSDFATIDNTIQIYFSATGKMPATLADLKSSNSNLTDQNLVDKVTKKAYGYQFTGNNATTYELCADFRTDNRNDNNDSYPGNQWLHGSGHQCVRKLIPAGQLKPVMPVPAETAPVK